MGGARIDLRTVLSPSSPRSRRGETRDLASDVPSIRVTVRAPAAWCRAALLRTAGDEASGMDRSQRTVRFELKRLGLTVRGTKQLDVEPFRVRAWLLSGRLPWFEETVELVPTDREETDLRWSAVLDPGDTVLLRLHVRLARRWLARDARLRLESVRQAATRMGRQAATLAAERVRVSA
jgi:hypothetical protein